MIWGFDLIDQKKLMSIKPSGTPEPRKTPGPVKPPTKSGEQVNNQDGDNGQRSGTNIEGDGNIVVSPNIYVNGPGTTRVQVRVGRTSDGFVPGEQQPCAEVPKRQYTPANATDQAVIDEEKKNETCPKRQARLTGDHPCGYDGIKRMESARQVWRAQNSGTTTSVESSQALLAKAEAAAASGNAPALPAGFGNGNDARLQGLRNVFHTFWNNDGKCIKFIDMKSEIPSIFEYAKAHGISAEEVGQVFLQSVKEDTPFSTALMARQWAQLAGSSAFKGARGAEFGTSFNTFGTVIANGAIRDGGLKPGQIVASFEGKAENPSFDNVLIRVGANGQAEIQGLSTNADALKMPGRIFYDFDGATTSGDTVSSSRTSGAFGDNGTVPVPGQGAPVNTGDLTKRIEDLRNKIPEARDFTPNLQGFNGASSFNSLQDLKGLFSELTGLRGNFSSNPKILTLIDSILKDLGRLISEKEGTPAPAGPAPTTSRPAAPTSSSTTPPVAKPESNSGQAILGLIDQIFNKDLVGVTTGNTAEIRGKILSGAGSSIDKLDSKGLGELLKNIEAYRAEAKNQGESISDSTNKKLDELTRLVKNKLTDVQLSSVKDLLFTGAQGTDNPKAPALTGFSSVGSLDSKGLQALKGEIEAFRGKGYTSPEQEKTIDNILSSLDNLIAEKKTEESIANRKSLEGDLTSLKDDVKLSAEESLKETPSLNSFSSLEGLTISELQALRAELGNLKSGDFVDNPTRAKIDSILGKLDTVIAEEKDKASKTTFQADTDHGLSREYYKAAGNGVKLLPPSVEDIGRDIEKAKSNFNSAFGDTDSSILNKWDDATKAKALRFVAQYATNIAEAMKKSGASADEIQAFTDKASALNAQADALEGNPPPGAFSQ